MRGREADAGAGLGEKSERGNLPTPPSALPPDLRTHVQRRQRRLERYVDLDTSPPVIVSVHGAAIDAAWRQWQAEQEQAAAE